jgi:DNA-binding FadR family transcriptional regulator
VNERADRAGRAGRVDGTGRAGTGLAGAGAVARAAPGVRPGVGPLSRQPAYQVLADELREQIASGRLRPGERLPPEPEMCTRSGLSRSTVREALRLLASQRLIVTTRGVTGGSFVAEPTAEGLGDSLAAAMRVLRSGMSMSGAQFVEVREMLEVPGAALAARRRTDTDLLALREALLVEPDDPDITAKLATYWRFRAALVASARNPLFTLLSLPLRQMANDRELSAVGPADLWHRAAITDRVVLNRVESRDADGAAAAVREHLAYLRDAYQAYEVRLSARAVRRPPVAPRRVGLPR